MFSLITAYSESSSASSGSSFAQMLPSLGIIVLMFVVMYFAIIRPQKKREKKDLEMRNQIQVGDEVITAGGIVGIVFSVKNDGTDGSLSTVVIETGSDRSKIRVLLSSVVTNRTAHEESMK